MANLMAELTRVNKLLDRIKISVLGVEFTILCFADKEEVENNSGRAYLQVNFQAPDSDTGKMDSFWGRKWYLSRFMIDDEIIKTAWLAFETAVKHELMEGFRIDGVPLFNPHVDFETLLRVSKEEIKRDNDKKERLAEEAL